MEMMVERKAMIMGLFHRSEDAAKPKFLNPNMDPDLNPAMNPMATPADLGVDSSW